MKRLTPSAIVLPVPSVVLSFLVLVAAASTSASTIFSEPFDYSLGSSLSGQNGGSGFSGAWSGGNSSIVSGLAGAPTAVQVGSDTASRSLSSAVSTASGDIFVAYRVNVANFSGGNYAGLSFWNGDTEELFSGIPWQAQSFGFDAHAGNGGDDIKSINFMPTSSVTYLIVLGLVDSVTSGKVDIKLWATSDLVTSISALVAGSPNAQLLGVKSDFTITSIRLAGDYSGGLKLGGLGSASTALEAAALSTPIPEPSTYGLVLGGLVLAGAAIRRRRANK